jgi:8-oxo-dGTP diphosphatase
MSVSPRPVPAHADRASADQEAPTAPRRLVRGAIGVLCQGDRFLLIQRAWHLRKGGFWCFPGGHIERGENSRLAVVRELREELGIQVEPVHRLGVVRVDRRFLLAAWVVASPPVELRPEPKEIADYAWLTLDQVRRLPHGLASNLIVVDRLAEYLATRH